MMEMESNAGKRKAEAAQAEDHIANAKRLKGSIALEAFSCGACAQLLRPPIFQCSSGLPICASCRAKLPDKNKCPFSCSGSGSGAGCALARNLGMERAARSILVDCRHADRGCTEKTAYYEQDSHAKVCPHAPCLCTEPGCGGGGAGVGFAAGSPQELLDHLTGHHGRPSTAFRYWVPIDLPVDEPGTQVLRCEEDGQVFLVNVSRRAAGGGGGGGGGRAVSVVGVPPYQKRAGFGCRAEFSCFRTHRGTAALDDVQPLRLADWPPSSTEFLCVLPEVSGGGPRVRVAPTVSVMFVCAPPCDSDDSDEDDSLSYVESDEDDSDCSN